MAETATTRAGEAVKRTPTLDEPPTELIERAAEQYTHCWVKVLRRNARGQLQHVCSGARKEVRELLDLESWLHKLGGGGEYRIEARNPDNLLEQLIPPFKVQVGGPPRPLDAGAAPEAWVAADPLAGGGVPYLDPRNPASYTDHVPPMYAPPQINADMGRHLKWANGLSAADKEAYMRQVGATLPPPSFDPAADPQLRFFSAAGEWALEQRRRAVEAGALHPLPTPTPYRVAQHTSDEIAVSELRQAREELKAEREERKREHAGWELKLQKLLDAQSGERDKYREELRRIEKESNDERFRQLQMQLQQQQQQPRSSPAEMMTPLAAALAPVLTALVQASRERDALALQTQQKQSELQQQSQQAFMSMMLSALGNHKDTSAELLLPVVLKQMESGGASAKAHAELLATLSEQNVTQIGMLMEAVQAAAGNTGINWGELIERIGQGVMGVMSSAGRQLGPGAPPAGLPIGVGEAMQAATAQAAAAQAAARAQAPVPGPPGAPSGVPSAAQVAQAVQAAQASGRELPPAEQLVLAIMTAPGFPAEFRTPQWRDVLLAVIEQRPPEEVADKLLDQLDALITSGKLPRILHDFPQQPEACLRRILQSLPLGPQHRPYLAQVLQLTLAGLQEEQAAAHEPDLVESTDDTEPEPEPIATAGNGETESEVQGAGPAIASEPAPVAAPSVPGPAPEANGAGARRTHTAPPSPLRPASVHSPQDQAGIDYPR